MSDWVIRRGVPSDADRLPALLPIRSGRPMEVVVAEWRAELQAGLDTGSPCCLMAWDGDELVAYSQARYVEPEPAQTGNTAPHGWYLFGVMVAESHRRLGIGHELTVRRLAWIAERADHAYYFTHPDNTASAAMHAAMGFKHVQGNIEITGKVHLRGYDLYRLDLT